MSKKIKAARTVKSGRAKAAKSAPQNPAVITAAFIALRAREAAASTMAQPVSPEDGAAQDGAAAQAAETLARIERHYAAAILQAERDQARDERARALHARFGHRQGTPETYVAIELKPDRLRQSALARMHRLGKISGDELAAALEIAQVVEKIERAVTVRSASLETRVDNAGSGRDVLVESLGRVRMEVAYRLWRNQLPAPAGLILDMIVRDQGYVEVAARHGVHYRTARKRLISALRLWMEVRIATRRSVQREDVEAAHARLGEGSIVGAPAGQRRDAYDHSRTGEPRT